jgi:hypothetical protein
MGSGATSRFALEYPIGTDSVNIPSDMETLANGLDALLFSLSIVAKSANYQAMIGQLVQMSGAHTVSSPAAGANVMWGALNAGSGTAVGVAATTGLLNLPGNYGAASISLPLQGDWAIFVCDGTNHNLIASSPSVMAVDLPLAGGTMTGAIAMGAHKITGLANGSASTDAAAFGQIPTATWPPAVDVLTVAAGAVTVPVTYPEVKITNNAASSVAITMATAGAVDGQTVIIRFYDYSSAAQTLTWVNTETGAAVPPTVSKGSTTIPTYVGFLFNGVTSKWACMAAG